MPEIAGARPYRQRVPYLPQGYLCVEGLRGLVEAREVEDDVLGEVRYAEGGTLADRQHCLVPEAGRRLDHHFDLRAREEQRLLALVCLHRRPDPPYLFWVWRHPVHVPKSGELEEPLCRKEIVRDRVRSITRVVLQPCDQSLDV